MTIKVETIQKVKSVCASSDEFSRSLPLMIQHNGTKVEFISNVQINLPRHMVGGKDQDVLDGNLVVESLIFSNTKQHYGSLLGMFKMSNYTHLTNYESRSARDVLTRFITTSMLFKAEEIAVTIQEKVLRSSKPVVSRIHAVKDCLSFLVYFKTSLDKVSDKLSTSVEFYAGFSGNETVITEFKGVFDDPISIAKFDLK